MRYNQFHFIIIVFLALMLLNPLWGQPWNFIKEKDGINIYTRVEAVIF
jgi:hypothetical protein